MKCFPINYIWRPNWTFITSFSKTYFYNLVKEQDKDLMKLLRGPIWFLLLLVFYVWILILLKKTTKCSEMMAYTTPWHAGDRNTAKILCASTLPKTRVVEGSEGERSSLNAMQGSLCVRVNRCFIFDGLKERKFN